MSGAADEALRLRPSARTRSRIPPAPQAFGPNRLNSSRQTIPESQQALFERLLKDHGAGRADRLGRAGRKVGRRATITICLDRPAPAFRRPRTCSHKPSPLDQRRAGLSFSGADRGHALSLATTTMATLGRRHLALGVAVVLTAAALLWSSTGVLSRLAWLLVLAPLLAISVLLVALPLSVGIAAVVERSLPRAAIDRRPSSASKAGARMRFTTEAAWSVVQLRSLWDTSSSSTWTPAADSTVVNPPSTAASSSSGSGLPSLVPPLVRASIDHVLALILRDFVRSWFGRLSPSLAFPHELEQTLREALGALIDRASRVDLADVVVGRIVPLLTAHLDGFAKAETALSGASSRRSTLLGGGGPADGLADVFLVQAFGGPAVSNNSSGGLHRAISGQAVDARPAQEAHLRLLVEGILARILPERNKSPIVEILAREVVTCAVLMPVVEMLADPDFWNRLLDEQVRSGKAECHPSGPSDSCISSVIIAPDPQATNHIRQQKLIHQLRAALETTSTTSTDPLPGPTLPPSASPSFVPTGTRVAPPRQRAASIASSRRGISSRTKPKAFEAFVKGIGRIEGVLDVRRMRSDIEREIRRTKEQLGVFTRSPCLCGFDIELTSVGCRSQRSVLRGG